MRGAKCRLGGKVVTAGSGESMRGRALSIFVGLRGLGGILLATMLLAGTAAAQPGPSINGLQIVGPSRPPYIVDNQGVGSGPAVELAAQILRAVGVADPVARILPFQRAVIELDKGSTLYPSLLRTPQREARYHWIGEVFAEQAVFFTMLPRPTVDNVARARDLERITVMRGSELYWALQSYGLENVETNNSETDNARLLRAGRIDGWFTLKAVGFATWTELGYDRTELQAGPAFAMISFWLAASHDIDPAVIARMKDAYREMQTDGRYQRIIAPLTALNARS